MGLQVKTETILIRVDDLKGRDRVGLHPHFEPSAENPLDAEMNTKEAQVFRTVHFAMTWERELPGARVDAGESDDLG